MKFRCLQEKFSKGLGTVNRAVASNRAILPMTQNVRMDVGNGMLTLTGTNLELMIRTSIGVDEERDGSITVPARLLTDFVNSLGAETIHCEVNAGTKVFHLMAGRSQANINGADAKDYPPAPVTDGDGSLHLSMEPKELRNAISKVAMAAATEDSRPVLTGVEMKVEDNGTDGNTFTMAAADGFRLAVYKGEITENQAGNISLIVPAKTMNELTRTLGNTDKSVDINIGRGELKSEDGQEKKWGPASQVSFHIHGDEETEVISNLLQGTFPDYDQLIPVSYTTKGTLDAPKTLRAAKTAAIFAKEAADIVRMEFNPGEDPGTGRLIISGRSDEIGQNSDELDFADVEGPEAKIAFNARFLVEAITTMEGGDFFMEITNSSSPGVFRPAEGEKHLQVVMPMFVQWDAEARKPAKAATAHADGAGDDDMPDQDSSADDDMPDQDNSADDDNSGNQDAEEVGAVAMQPR